MTLKAIVLIGPTGSGKTPLGDLLERSGVWGRRCVHFDFGRHLRAAAQGQGGALGLSGDEVAVIRQVLREGALLEDGQFGIAEAILRGFLASSWAAGDGAAVVLNGLPRHVGQAAGLERVVDVVAVVSLDCEAGAVRERIRKDVGADREGRTDDGAGEVERRIEVFRARTAPLLEHYSAAGARVIRLEVGPRTTADELRRELERLG